MSAQVKELHLKFHGRILDQFGFQTYQSPTASIAELVTNSWDADALRVDVFLPEGNGEKAELIVEDNGIGMTFKECEDKYLNVGWNRRGDQVESFSPKGRRILGRKGIGKFAGFGIAEIMVIETVSGATGEKTAFEMNINDLRGDDFIIDGGKIGSRYLPPAEERRKEHGTRVVLKSLRLGRAIPPSQFARSMARRFLLHKRAEGFEIYVNKSPIPTTEDYTKIEFAFPHDYKDPDKPPGLTIVDEEGNPSVTTNPPDEQQRFREWGQEVLSDGNQVRWRVFFYKDTIDDTELQGISIFSNRKLTQRPFFFELSGGLGGQHGQAYMSGQVQADFVDRLKIDPISAERQRINWGIAETSPLLQWGQERVKKLLPIWQEKRGEAKRVILEAKVAGFADRVGKLPASEAKTVRRVLLRLGGLATLTDAQFQDLGQAILTSWEQGRLHELIAEIADTNKMSESDLLKILVEADTLTALNVAEVAKTKLLTLAGLKERLDRNELERAVRDYIACNPWIISPRWETFKVEKKVRKIITDAAAKVGFTDGKYEGRVDLVLSSGSQLLVLEFMRPGLTIDWEHIERYERYCIEISIQVSANTASEFNSVTGQIVADKIANDPAILTKIKTLRQVNMLASDWNSLLEEAKASWKELLEILSERSDDPRIASLMKE